MLENHFKSKVKIRNYRGLGKSRLPKQNLAIDTPNVPNLECQWPNFALVTVICQDLYNFWFLPYFWSGFLMSKFEFSYVYPKCFWMRFQWYKFQVLIINDSKVRESFRGPVYRLHWGCPKFIQSAVTTICVFSILKSILPHRSLCNTYLY
jgi:hypothetical protein